MIDDIKKILFTEEDIKNIISKLASELNLEYKNKRPVVLGLLKGCLPFMSDLVKRLDFDLEVEYIKVSSYEGTKSTNNIKIIGYVPDLKGKDVILIDDIIDTGKTINEIQNLVMGMKALSFKSCVLLDKVTTTKNNKADYVGATIRNEFVVGYGFDYNESYRNLPFIGVLKDEIYK